MTKQAAYKRAVKMFGKDAMVREWKGAPIGAERAARLAAEPGRKAELAELNATIWRQHREGKGNPTPEQVARRKALGAAALGVTRRCAVGRTLFGGFAFSIEGDGDTWEEAFAAAETRQKGRATA